MAKAEVTKVKEEPPSDVSEEEDEDEIPDFKGDYDALLEYVKRKKDDHIIAQARLKRQIAELKVDLKRKLAKHRIKSVLKKDKKEIAKEILAKYFSEAQINYLLEWKKHQQAGPGGGGGGEQGVKVKVEKDRIPAVRWNDADVNKFAKLKAHVRIVGYNYIRRMNIVPMPSLNILQKAQRDGKLSADTLALIDRKIRSRTAPSCVPKTGLRVDFKPDSFDNAENIQPVSQKVLPPFGNYSRTHL